MLWSGVLLSDLIEGFKENKDNIFLPDTTVKSWTQSGIQAVAGWFGSEIPFARFSAGGLRKVYRKIASKSILLSSTLKAMQSDKERDDFLDNLSFEQVEKLRKDWRENYVYRSDHPYYGLSDLVVGVTVFDLNARQFEYLSSVHYPMMKIVDALLSTSAAPTYFPIHNFTVQNDAGNCANYNPAPDMSCACTPEGLKGEVCPRCFSYYEGTPPAPDAWPPNLRDFSCVDGGMFANDPQLMALLWQRVVPIHHNTKRKTFFVLSFGTGYFTPKFDRKKAEKRTSEGLVTDWILPGSPYNAIDIMFTASATWVPFAVNAMNHANMVRSHKIELPLTSQIDLADVHSLGPQSDQVREFFAGEFGSASLDLAVAKFGWIPDETKQPEKKPPSSSEIPPEARQTVQSSNFQFVRDAIEQ